MSAPRKNYDAAVSAYSAGLSVEKIAITHGISRQAMWKILRRRGVAMRIPEACEEVIFQGCRYTLRPNGYFAMTVSPRRYLHRDVWEYHNGPIPDGYEIHHRDEDKRNNCITNLEMLTSSEHGEKHGFGGNQFVQSTGRRPVK